MSDPRLRPRFLVPELGTAADFGLRARTMRRDPRVIQLAAGHWARMPGTWDLEHRRLLNWERTALLQLSLGLGWVHDRLEEPRLLTRVDDRAHLVFARARPH